MRPIRQCQTFFEALVLCPAEAAAYEWPRCGRSDSCGASVGLPTFPTQPTLHPMDTSWFNDLFGFEERSAEQVRTHLEVDGSLLRSRCQPRQLPDRSAGDTLAGRAQDAGWPASGWPSSPWPHPGSEHRGVRRAPSTLIPVTPALSSRSPRSSTCWRWCHRMFLPRTA